MTSTSRDEQRKHLFFTWAAQNAAHPFEIVEAAGARFRTDDGVWRFDLESQVYNVNVGHGHPHVKRRMLEQIEQLPAAAPNVILPVRARLGGLLARHTGLEKAFLSTGGSEAVENAIKMALLYTGRTKVVTRRTSYHGATLAVLGYAGDARKKPFEAVLHPSLHLDDPYPWRAPTSTRPSDWVENLERLLAAEGPETIAALVLEGLTGTNGMHVPPPDFWPRARELCTQHGIVLIDDEIFAGFGRTGRWFAKEHFGVEPDMMVLGKGLTSGYAPLSAVMVNESIARHFDDHVLWCGLTSYAHPVSCAAAVGAIEALEQDGLVANAERVGRALDARLERLRAPTGPGTIARAVRDLRGLGLMRLVEFDRPTAPLSALLWERGLYAPVRGNTLMICPPLCITEAEIHQVVDEVEAGLAVFLGA